MKLLKAFDKFNNSPKGKVIKSIFMLVFSLALIATATCAWFFSSVSVTSAGMTLSVLNGGSYAKYSAFYISDIDTKTVAKQDQTTQSGTDNLEFELRTYDKTFKSLNSFARVVVRMEVYNLSETNIPDGEGTKSLNVQITRDASLDPDTTSSNLGGVFSSVGQVGCYTSSGLDLSSSNSTIYNTVIDQYESANNAQTFTTITNNVITKTNLSINVTYTASDFKIGDDGRSCLLLYVVFDYNPELTELYIETHDGHISNDLSKIDILAAV